MRQAMSNRMKPFGMAVTLLAAGLGNSVVSANECMIGEVRMFAGNFAPRNWAFTDGQLLAISQHQALFSILGTFYGGDGRTTFALPDLRGRAAIHVGQGPGLNMMRIGQKTGQEMVRLNRQQMPSHSHPATSTLKASNARTDQKQPAGHALAITNRATYAASQAATAMRDDSIVTQVGNAGSSKPVPVRDPSLGINHIICLQGIYPSRN